MSEQWPARAGQGRAVPAVGAMEGPQPGVAAPLWGSGGPVRSGCPWPRAHPRPLPSLSSVSTIRNQRYHIHANLSFALLVAQVLLLVSFHCQPGTVSGPLSPL